jgi:hypothetical protein
VITQSQVYFDKSKHPTIYKSLELFGEDELFEIKLEAIAALEHEGILDRTNYRLSSIVESPYKPYNGKTFKECIQIKSEKLNQATMTMIRPEFNKTTPNALYAISKTQCHEYGHQMELHCLTDYFAYEHRHNTSDTQLYQYENINNYDKILTASENKICHIWSMHGDIYTKIYHETGTDTLYFREFIQTKLQPNDPILSIITIEDGMLTSKHFEKLFSITKTPEEQHYLFQRFTKKLGHLLDKHLILLPQLSVIPVVNASLLEH